MVPTGQLKDSAPSPNPPKPTSTELDHQQDPSGHRTMIQDAIDDAPMNRIDHATEEAIRRFLVLLDGRYSVARTILYGSRARGTHRPDSDADVAVLLNGEHQRFLTTKLDMADVAYEVLLETGIHISPLPVTSRPCRFGSMNGSIRRRMRIRPSCTTSPGKVLHAHLSQQRLFQILNAKRLILLPLSCKSVHLAFCWIVVQSRLVLRRQVSPLLVCWVDRNSPDDQQGRTQLTAPQASSKRAAEFKAGG